MRRWPCARRARGPRSRASGQHFARSNDHRVVTGVHFPIVPATLRLRALSEPTEGVELGACDVRAAEWTQSHGIGDAELLHRRVTTNDILRLSRWERPGEARVRDSRQPPEAVMSWWMP